MRRYSAPMIEDEQAYEAGKQTRIKANARKSGRAAWLAEHADAQRLSDFLCGVGEFQSKVALGCNCVDHFETDNFGYDYQAIDHSEECLDGKKGFTCRRVQPRISRPYKGGFAELLNKFQKDLDDWGKLSPKQTQIVRDALAKAEGFASERDAKRAAETAERAATSQHVGTVGERIDFDLVVERTLTFEGTFGATYFNICRDADGNVVIYKGSNHWDQGPIRVKATVKAHESRDGVAQTLIARPKVL